MRSLSRLQSLLVALAVLLAAPVARAQDAAPEGEEGASAEGSEAQGGEAAASAPTAATLAAPSDGADAPEEAEPTAPVAGVDTPPAAEPEPLPWRNSILSFDQALSANTLDPGATQSPNPYYAWFFTLRPRWYLTDAVFLAVQQGLNLELTDTDSRARNREPVLTDTSVDLIWGNAFSIPLGVGNWGFSPGLRAVLPLSIQSRAQELYFGVGPSVATRLPIADVMHGLLFGWNVRYQHNFQGTNVTTTETSFPCFSLESSQVRCSNTGGPSSDSDALITTVLASLSPFENMTLDTSFTWWWRFGHELKTARVPVDSAPDGFITVGDGSETHMRLATVFSVGASYNIVQWLNLALTLNTFSAEFASNGDRRNPFYNVYDSTIDLTATMVLDQFYTAAFGGSGEGSTPTNPRNQVQNTHRPVVAF